MSKAFLDTLSKARDLDPQEQLALIAILSEYLARDQSYLEKKGSAFEGMLPEEDEALLLARIKSYEEGRGKTIKGSDFRQSLKKKFGS